MDSNLVIHHCNPSGSYTYISKQLVAIKIKVYDNSTIIRIVNDTCRQKTKYANNCCESRPFVVKE